MFQKFTLDQLVAFSKELDKATISEDSELRVIADTFHSGVTFATAIIFISSDLRKEFARRIENLIKT